MRRWLVAAIVIGAAPAAHLDAQGSAEELTRFSAVLSHIRANYVDSVTYKQLVHSAIDGMLKGLDPHSWYLSSEDNARFNALERGELAEIGVSVEIADGTPIILAVTESSPADHAGVHPGDRLLAVDGVPTAGLNARVIALRLAGEKGSKVRLTLERGPKLEPDSVSVQIKRDIAKPQHYVRATLMLDATTGYVKLGEFGVKSAEEVHDAVKSLKSQKATKLILDLRGNPGGIVTEAIAIASQFLPANSLVFSTKGRQRSVNQEYRTKDAGDFQDIPMVVLVDRGSASAAEALAGSLQDNDRAVIGGRRSFGKALMQTGFLVPDGFVELTIGHVISPSGRYIQRPYSGLQLEQYYAFAGDSAWQDSTRVFKTVNGRPVKGGGGIAPDVTFPAPATAPRWWTVAADSGWDRAVADSVAGTLSAGAAAGAVWVHDTAAWTTRLLPPLLARVRARLAVSGALDPATSEAMARKLAAEAATVRWGDAVGREVTIRNDPDVVAAIGLFGRLREILHK